MKRKYSVEKYLAVKNALIDEFDFTEKKVSQAWLDVIDCDPDPNNPDHWDLLLYNKEKFYYVNMKFFPRISIEPGHTDTHQLGVIYVNDDVTPGTVVWYVHNVTDGRGNVRN